MCQSAFPLPPPPPPVTIAPACLPLPLLGRHALALGRSVRWQLVWGIEHFTLRTTQVTLSRWGTSEVVAMAGPDAELVSWTMSYLFYLPLLPFEVVAMVALTCLEVGVAPGFVALVPLVVLVGFSMILLRAAIPHKDAAHDISDQRFNVLDEALTANPAVKLYDTSEVLLDKMKEMRAEEERHLRWVSASYATALSLQIFLAPLMAWIASELTNGCMRSILLW